jgi:hypothetical protein|tara:strand:+ start:442 stop:717 length:276 start_codon:yes stop_codon:yes gene_type:complete
MINDVGLSSFEDIDEITDEILLSLDTPSYILTGEGWGWYLDPTKGTMVKVRKGIEVIPLEDIPDDHGRILVQTAYQIILVPSVEVDIVGWN